MRTPIPVRAFLVAALLALGGCDQARIVDASRSAQPPIFQPRTVRSLVSPSGLERLYRVDYPVGIDLQRDSLGVDQFGMQLSLGPIAKTVPVDNWQITTDTASLAAEIDAQDVSVTVPVRVQGSVGTRVCRFLVETDRVVVDADAAMGKRTVPVIVTSGAPAVTLSNPSVTQVGSCPEVEGLSAAEADALDQRLVDYLRGAWSASAVAALEISPLDALGLVHAPLDIEHISSFENRRGRMQLSGRVTGSNGAQLSAAGLNLDLDMSINAQRAPCAPALSPEAPATLSADEVPPDALGRTGADMGLTIAAPLLVRLAQTSSVAGFACSGLESPELDGSGSNLATDDLALGDIGLGELPIGPWTEPVIVPGALPEITTDPANDSLQLDWKDLHVDFYAQMQGVPVRILQLTASVIVSLRPVERLDRIDLTVDAVDVTDTSIQSQWLYERPFDSNLMRWSKRALLLVLDGAFSLPLPLDPSAPLHLVQSQVRTNDLLLLFSFDRVF